MKDILWCAERLYEVLRKHHERMKRPLELSYDDFVRNLQIASDNGGAVITDWMNMR